MSALAHPRPASPLVRHMDTLYVKERFF